MFLSYIWFSLLSTRQLARPHQTVRACRRQRPCRYNKTFLFRLQAPSNTMCTAWKRRSGQEIQERAHLFHAVLRGPPDYTRDTCEQGAAPPKSSLAKSFPEARITAAQERRWGGGVGLWGVVLCGLHSGLLKEKGLHLMPCLLAQTP